MAEPTRALNDQEQEVGRKRLRRAILGAPRDVSDPKTYHQISLVAFLAWVGLGADGLSSSSYGPEEAFKALGHHSYLAVGLAIATGITVFVLSASYSRIIEHFPFGGGGYVVAGKLLGPKAGVVSGAALVVDYVLTITVSVAAGADAVFSFLPEWTRGAKLPIEFIALALLVLLNLRGVKESVKVIVPVFLVFVATHLVLILGTLVAGGAQIPVVASEIGSGARQGLAQLGVAGVLMLLMRAYSMGAGTYTGIEAVSNGLSIMREPKVETGKRTMTLMAVSLSLTATGIILAYLLLHVSPVAGKTMNAVLVERFAGGWQLGSWPVGHWFVVATLASEALLLVVAAQAGIIAGPRTMANMATDSYLPRRFAQLSDRLTMSYGVLLMGAASAVALLYTRGDVGALVVMYSINVFVTFSLAQLGMCVFWLRERRAGKPWRRSIAVHVVGLALCVFILAMTVYEKFEEGGWRTLVLTGFLVAACFLIRHQYRKVERSLGRLDQSLADLPLPEKGDAAPVDPARPTAVLLVGGYGGLGVHSLLSIQRLFPQHFKSFLFLSVGVIDSATFKDVAEVEAVRERTRRSLAQYVELARRLGLPADSRMAVGTEATEVAVSLCREVASEFRRSIFFAGKLVFEEERWFHAFLHNETAYQNPAAAAVRRARRDGAAGPGARREGGVTLISRRAASGSRWSGCTRWRCPSCSSWPPACCW
ncbi:MAG: APC family permease [Myxococcales bacterium]